MAWLSFFLGLNALTETMRWTWKPASDFIPCVLGMQLTEQIRLNNGARPAVWYRANNKSYEVVYTKDATGMKAVFIMLPFP